MFCLRVFFYLKLTCISGETENPSMAEGVTGGNVAPFWGWRRFLIVAKKYRPMYINQYSFYFTASSKYFNMGCDHGRANEYFLESIDHLKCKFRAIQCANYTNFETGLCQKKNSQVAEMGFHNKMIPGLKFPAKFFLRTNKEMPFCNENSFKIKKPKKKSIFSLDTLIDFTLDTLID